MSSFFFLTSSHPCQAGDIHRPPLPFLILGFDFHLCSADLPYLVISCLFVWLICLFVCLFLNFFTFPFPFDTRERPVWLHYGVVSSKADTFYFFSFCFEPGNPSVSLLPVSSLIMILSQFTPGKNRSLLLCQKYNIQEKARDRKNESILTVYRDSVLIASLLPY